MSYQIPDLDNFGLKPNQCLNVFPTSKSNRELKTFSNFVTGHQVSGRTVELNMKQAIQNPIYKMFLRQSVLYNQTKSHCIKIYLKSQ
jgi:hypothetical protein